MRKIYTKELGPKPVPLIVPGEAITEEDVSFITPGFYLLHHMMLNFVTLYPSIRRPISASNCMCIWNGFAGPLKQRMICMNIYIHLG